MSFEGPGEALEHPDAGVAGHGDPELQMRPAMQLIGTGPEASQLFLEDVGDRRRAVEIEQASKSLDHRSSQILLAPEQEIASALEYLLEPPGCLAALLVAQGIEQLRIAGHQMIAVEDHRDIGIAAPDRLETGGPHVDGNGQEVHPKPLQAFWEGQDGILPSSHSDMDDIAGLEIDADRQVVIPLADRYLIDAEIADLLQPGIRRLLLDESALVDRLDRAPGQREQPGNVCIRRRRTPLPIT